MPKKSADAIGFAVVGLGMGRHHCRSIREAEGAELIAVCDLDAGRREQAAKEFGCKAYASVDELLQDSDVQVVNVAVPTGRHADVGIKVAQSGRHVICEKPLDVDLERADSLIAACHDHGVKLASIFQRRLHPLSRRIKETIDGGRLGRLHYADIHLYWYRTAGYYAGGNPPGWRGTFALDGGGACMNQGIHSIDLISWLAGGVASVYAKTGTFTHQIEAEDVGTVLVTFRNGALGNITCTTSAYPGLTNDLHLFGHKGSIAVSDEKVTAWRIRHEDGDEVAEKAEEQEMMARYSGSAGSGAADPLAVGFDGHTVHVEDMVQAIREQRDPIIAGTDARHAVEICAAIQQSAATGKEIVLSAEVEIRQPAGE
ncbi:MAG: Gfo/Idh/MocA family oxidoreductase [Chloroflexota bacterium]|nr:Gfo/Idh/MocA family oxidoreductase [Chloroflexota bacterium]